MDKWEIERKRSDKIKEFLKGNETNFKNIIGYVDPFDNDEYINFFKTTNFGSIDMYDELSFRVIDNYQNGVDLSNCFADYFRTESTWKDSTFTDRYWKSVVRTNDYIKSVNGKWNVYYVHDKYLLIGYNKLRRVIDRKIVNFEPLKDYSKMSYDQLKAISSNQEFEKKSNNEVSTYTEIDIYSNLDDYRSKMEDIKDEKIDELATAKEEINKLEKEMREKQSALNERKKELENELMIKVEEMNRQLFLLESQIYTIRCLYGEVIHFAQLRSGIREKQEEPLIVYQKLRFLDEEFGKLDATEKYNFNNHEHVEQSLANEDDILDVLCPDKKCVSLIKVSKNNRVIGSDNTMLQNFEAFHGNQLAIIIRDGDNVFMGWCDEEKIKIQDDVIVSDNTSEISSKESVASRLFIFSILQGAYEHSQFINLPYGVDFAKGSKFVIWSLADRMIKNHLYKPFSIIMKNLHQFNKVGDEIYIIRGIGDGRWEGNSYGQGRYVYERGREDSWLNRTSDASVEDGVNRINLYEKTKSLYSTYANGDPVYYHYFYVSAKKEYSMHDARANMKIHLEEFINIKYISSLFVEHYIIHDNIGGIKVDNASFDYANFVKHLKKMKNYIRSRETQELFIIKRYVALDNSDQWENYLASWKLINKVRKITDFQAKRFAKWFGNINSLSSEEIDYYKNFLVINDIEDFNGEYDV